MTISPTITWSLQIGSGVFWTIVYLLIIKLGFKDKTYGMPQTALCANLSWELIFSLIHPHDVPQIYINITWLSFDLVILYQTIRFGKPYFKRNLPAKLFYPTLFLTLILSFCAVLFITYEFKDWQGKYAAFGQNLMMSVLFVSMLLKRNNVRGQSMYIALFKMLGTLLPSILFFMHFPSSYLLTFLYIAIFTFDFIYVVMLYAKHKELRINPWKRF
jgi:hypothetical protein